MSARTWWSAKADPKDTAEKPENRAGEDPDLSMDELLDARFDEEGRLSQLGHGSQQRVAERMDPRPAQTGMDELDLAVQKLSEGLEAIERQGREARSADAAPAASDQAAGEPAEAGDRDFVTYSLDRLEARLEALSRRLQQKSSSPAGPVPGQPVRRPAPQPAAQPAADTTSQLTESRRLAEAEAARLAASEATAKARQAELAAEARLEAERARSEAERARREAERARREADAAAEAEQRRQAEAAAEIAEAREQAEAAESRRQREVAEVRRQAELAEARRQAEVTEARRQAELAEGRRLAEAEAAAEERQRTIAEAEAVRLAELEEVRRDIEAAEARHRTEVEEARRQAEIGAARRDAELAARLERQFTEIEGRIDALQQGLDENQVEPVRGELLGLMQQITDLSRGGTVTANGLDAIGDRLDQMEVKLNAARNMAGNRLGDIQDRLGGLVDRLDELEVEIPGFDAIRVNQSAILERFDRMEGLVNQLASPEELFDRVEALKRQIQNVASQREVARIEAEILRLAERLDGLPDELSDKAVLTRIEDQLGGLANEFTEARRQRKSVASGLDERLSDLSAQLRDVGETGRTPDLSGVEDRLAAVAAEVAEDRVTTGDTLARLERRLGALADAIENQEDGATEALLQSLTQRLDVLAEAVETHEDAGAKDLLNGLTRKVDSLAEAVEAHEDAGARHLLENLSQKVDSLAESVDAQDAPGARREIAGIGRRLEQIGENLAEQAEALSRRQGEPLTQRLQSIEERISGLASKATDPRALQTQIEAIVSRLELLKGRSIDPARLNDLFDRVDAAVRAIPEERFDRLEQKLEEIIPPAERFDRLERKIAETADGAAAERFSNLERKLDEISRIFTAGSELLTQEDLTDLRSDIVALRRELRSGLGQGEANLGELMRTLMARLESLPQEAPANVSGLEAQMARIATILEDSGQSRPAFAQIETSLRSIEERLDETRRTLDRSVLEGESKAAASAEVESVAGLARSLSDDVTVLKSSAETTERNTRDAIDAVQGTLEAVVKRMAFLERDSDTASAADKRPAAPPPAAASPAAAVAISPSPSPTPPAWPADKPEAATESGPGGLLGRLTSRQLLRRATGGRAESFSPEAEEADESSDFPLEPGTDAPLSSALTGAPSSNTEFMSGARKGRVARPAEEDSPRRAGGRSDPAVAVDDDFLAAARRAARAATQETHDTDSAGPAEPRSSGFFGRHRRALLAAAIAAALIVAAIPLLRTQLWPDETEIAAVPEASAPEVQPEAAATPDLSAPTPAPAPEASAQSAEPDTSAPPAAAPAPEMAASPPPAAATPQPESSAQVSSEAGTEAPASGSSLRPDESENSASPPETTTAAATPDATPPAENPAPQASSEPEQPPAPASDVASVSPDAIAGAATAPSAPAPESMPPAAETTQPVPPLPEAIGSPKLRDAAMAGNTSAAFEVAARYAEGRGVMPDMATAVLWYKRAAEAGLAPAQYRLGSIYEKGLGVTKDLTAAQMWYGRAADAGNVKAMHNLAVLFAEGAGGTPDLEKASALFRQAAERGVRDSQFNLAILHARGLGVPQDLVEAYKWFGIAASSGDEESAKRRDIIGEALSAGDKSKAEAAIATFKPVPLVPGANEVLLPEGGWADSENSTSVDLRDQNALVALVQKLLAENGYDPGPADGVLGAKTIDAITTFQGKAGLPKTGQIDTGLVAALQTPST